MHNNSCTEIANRRRPTRQIGPIASLIARAAPWAWLTAALLVALLVAGCGDGKQRVSEAPQPKQPPSPEPLEADNATVAPEVQAEYWEASFIGSAKVGHNHTLVESIEVDGQTLIRTTSDQELVLARDGDVARQSLRLESLEHEDGAVVRMSSEIGSEDVRMQTRAVVDGDTLQLTQSAGGAEQTIQIPWSGAGGYFALYQSLEKSPLEPGESREIKSFMPAVNQVATIQMNAASKPGVVPMLENQRSLLEVNVVLAIGPTKLNQQIWIDESGAVVRAFDPQLKLTTYRTTRELALAKSDEVVQFDNAVFIKATGKPLRSPHDRNRATYVMTMSDGDPSKIFASGPRQRVRSLGKGRAEIEVIRNATPAPTLERVSKQDLEGNTLIQADDPMVRAMANSVATDKRDIVEIARALEALVHDKVEQKDYTRAFDSAADVARKLQGDCTEHSVLLAALCRARDIPSRVASGLVAYRDGFAYHMWTEVWTGAAWMPLDATLGQGGIGVGHIKLIDSNLAGANSFAALLPVLQVIGKLQIHVEAVQ